MNGLYSSRIWHVNGKRSYETKNIPGDSVADSPAFATKRVHYD